MLKRDYTYFIQGEITELIKIGSSYSPSDRLNDFMIGSPDMLKIIKVVDGIDYPESFVRRKFKQFQSHGEWFFPESPLLEFIKSIPAVDYPKPTRSSVRYLKERQKRLEYAKAYYEKNKERISAYQKKHYLERKK